MALNEEFFIIKKTILLFSSLYVCFLLFSFVNLLIQDNHIRADRVVNDVQPILPSEQDVNLVKRFWARMTAREEYNEEVFPTKLLTLVFTLIAFLMCLNSVSRDSWKATAFSSLLITWCFIFTLITTPFDMQQLILIVMQAPMALLTVKFSYITKDAYKAIL